MHRDFEKYLLTEDAKNAPVWVLGALGKMRQALGHSLSVPAYQRLRQDLESIAAKASATAPDACLG